MISKAIDIYKHKGYKFDTEHLFKFIRKSVNSPDQILDHIQDEISSRQDGNWQFTEEQLALYLHLIAAVQADQDVTGRGLKQFQGYSKIKFKSSKDKKNGKEDTQKSQANEEKQQEKHVKIEVDKNQQKSVEKEKPKKSKSKKKKSKSKKKAQRKQEAIEASDQQPPKQQKKPQSPKKPQKKSQSPREPQVSPPTQPAQSPKIPPKKQSSSSSHKQKQKLVTIQQNTVEEDRSSNVMHSSNSQQFFAKFPEAQLMKRQESSKKVIQIKGFDKYGQNYFNPIIKYRIVYKEKSIYRRYTQFQNLMRHLNKRWEGFILPELPPKEGIKSNLSYFWGVDEAFLNDRQIKLEQMMNVLMNSKFINQDQILHKFITEQDFEVESDQTNGAFNYLRSLGEIAFNVKELKTYGMAYYNYFKSFKRTIINTNVTNCYKKAQPILSYCLELENYRLSIINNFDKRREIFAELELDKDDVTLKIMPFDKLSSASAAQVRNLEKQMNKYYELKSQESWLSYLISQKEREGDYTVEQIKHQQKQIKSRIANMEINLIDSIDSLVRNKTAFIEDIQKLMIEWRKSIHP